MKKNVLAATVLGALAVLGVTACSPASDSGASPSPSVDETTAADLAALDTVEWTDSDGVPSLSFESPFMVGGITTRLVADGDGAEITDGQNVTLDYVVYSGSDGSTVYSTYDQGTPEVVTLTQGQVVQNLYDALVGRKVGADLLYVYPDDTAEDGSAVLMAVTVQDATTPLPRAEGTVIEPAAGLPTVTLADSGAPSIDFSTATEMPTDLVVQPLIKGDGATVAEGDQVTVHYTGWLWDGDQFDSSWDRGAPASFTLAAGSLIDGWVEGLAGQTVGSQVLLIIPPDLGYGDQDSGSIPAGSTLVFVVDILAVG